MKRAHRIPQAANSGHLWPRGTRGPVLLAAAAIAACGALTGCAAITNPVANGIPVRRLPPELLAPPKEGLVTIPLNLLRQKLPEGYQLGPGDILGVYLEGILGQPDDVPPVNFPESPDLPPAIGFPMPIRADGTVSLPLVEPVRVEGLTIEEAEQAIIKAYTVDRKILARDQERIIVTLIRRRTVRVLVFREDNPEAANISIQTGALFGTRGGLAGTGGQPSSRQGAGYELELPVGQNDVLNALARTGGLPGTDAVNELVILRGHFEADEQAVAFLESFVLNCPPDMLLLGEAGDADRRIIRIPLRIAPGAPLPFRPEDIVLETGDILFIQARDAELFYTGGLLPPGQFALPRDFDLDVIEAVTSVGGPLVSGGFATNLLSGAILNQGLGNPSPSQLTVVRRTPDGGQVPIEVDLNLALRDPRERILVQPGDVLILQETPDEALSRYVSQVFSFNLFSDLIRTSRTTGTASVIVP
jgi:protein involved in polysaccharide export with SLBB domain